MNLQITQLAITLITTQTIRLQEHSGSALRGGFGQVLRELTCSRRDKECKDCLLNANCVYSQFFDPIMTDKESEETSNRFNTKPRPFVLQPETNDHEIFYPGQKIRFNLNIFGSIRKFLPYIVESWRVLGEEGIGQGKGKFILSEIWNVNDLTGTAERIYTEYASIIHNSEIRITQPDVEEILSNLPHNELRLKFISPVLLKYKGDFVKRIEFHVLMRNLFRRISSISYFYGDEKLDINFDEFLQKAQEVKILKSNTNWQTWERYSNRQEQRIQMHGVVGQIVYQGNLKDYLPFLVLGQYIHVGKNTVFGQGNYKIIPGV